MDVRNLTPKDLDDLYKLHPHAYHFLVGRALQNEHRYLVHEREMLSNLRRKVTESGASAAQWASSDPGKRLAWVEQRIADLESIPAVSIPLRSNPSANLEETAFEQEHNEHEKTRRV